MSFRVLMLGRQDDDLLAHTANLGDAALFTPGAPANEVIAGDVLIHVDWSATNYKDGLAITGEGLVVCKWPVMAGTDGAGVVLNSSHLDWRTSDVVMLNGWGTGKMHWDCLAQQARLPGDWLVALPAGLDVRQAMATGTAGYTMMLLVLALGRVGAKPGGGEVLATGISGGVDLTVIALLGKLGYCMVTSIGKTSEAGFLQALGAGEVIDRAGLSVPGKLLQRERWAAVVDSVGSYTLVNTCAQARYGGVVTVREFVQGMDSPATAAPFILRDVALCGTGSVMASRTLRKTTWQCLATDLLSDRLAVITREVTLSETTDATYDIMTGRIRGRVVVDVNW